MLLIALMWLMLFLQTGRWSFWEVAPAPGVYYDDARTVVALVGALALGVTIWTAVRTQGANEDKFEREQRDRDLDRSREREQDRRARYSVLSEQISSASPAARIAAVYATAALADEFGVAGDRLGQQNCIDVLCSYLRITVPLGPETPEAKGTAGMTGTLSEATKVQVRADIEMRRTIFTVIREHCSAKLQPPFSWSGYRFDLRGAQLVDANLSDVRLVHGGHLDLSDADVSGELKLGGGQWEAGEVKLIRTKFLPGARLDLSGTTIDGGLLRLHPDTIHGGYVGAKNLKIVSGGARFLCRDVTNSAISFEAMEVRGGTVTFDIRLRDHAHLRLARIDVQARLHLKVNLREQTSVRLRHPKLGPKGVIKVEGTTLQPGASFVIEQPLGDADGRVDIDKPQFNGGRLRLRGLVAGPGPKINLGGLEAPRGDTDLLRNLPSEDANRSQQNIPG